MALLPQADEPPGGAELRAYWRQQTADGDRIALKLVNRAGADGGRGVSRTMRRSRDVMKR